MTQTILTRDTFTPYETCGTMGIVGADFHCDTIEQPDNHDIPDHSCVPLGVYQLVPHTSGHLHERDGSPLQTYALVNPDLGITHHIEDPIPAGCKYPHRAECLVHPDNVAATLHGCIGPGDSRQQLPDSGRWFVTNSRTTFEQWRAILSTGTGHTLEIREAR